jgi:phosphopantothenate---cysteine ligase (ATP)
MSSVESFFQEAPPLKVDISGTVDNFIKKYTSRGVRIAVVTSGGTTVPLERQCVRFIDNFSKGTRGALSAEEFLAHGYAVILLGRSGSAQPFLCDFQERLSMESLVNEFDLRSDDTLSLSAGLQRLFTNKTRSLKTLESAKNGMYLYIPYTTLFQYLQQLKIICVSLRQCQNNAIIYLAAAVSDFYIPWQELPEHKIQSRDNGALKLELQMTPKMLGVIKKEWCPEAMVVSFKLETDTDLLQSKMETAARLYGIDMIVGNILSTRKQEVVVYQKNEKKWMMTKIECPQGEEAIVEEPLVTHIVEHHTRSGNGLD